MRCFPASEVGGRGGEELRRIAPTVCSTLLALPKEAAAAAQDSTAFRRWAIAGCAMLPRCAPALGRPVLDCPWVTLLLQKIVAAGGRACGSPLLHGKLLRD